MMHRPRRYFQQYGEQAFFEEAHKIEYNELRKTTHTHKQRSNHNQNNKEQNISSTWRVPAEVNMFLLTVDQSTEIINSCYL